MVRLQRLTGMRPAEVCILRKCDIDTTGDVWLYRPVEQNRASRPLSGCRHRTPGPSRFAAVSSPRRCGILLFPEGLRTQTQTRGHSGQGDPFEYGNRPGSNRKRSPKREADNATRRTPTAEQSTEVRTWLRSPGGHRINCGIQRQPRFEVNSDWKRHRSHSVTQTPTSHRSTLTDLAKAVDVARRIG